MSTLVITWPQKMAGYMKQKMAGYKAEIDKSSVTEGD